MTLSFSLYLLRGFCKHFPLWNEKKSNVNDGKDLLLKYNSIQNASTDNIQILQYLITRGIHMLKDVVLQHKSKFEEYALIKFQQARIPKELWLPKIKTWLPRPT